MTKINRFFRYILLLGVVFSLLSCTEQRKEPVKEEKPAALPTKPLRKAPDFTLSSVMGGLSVSLSDFEGKVVLLDFWATWCPPCKASIPNMNKLYEKYNEKGFEIIGVSVDNIRNIQDQAKVKNFVKRYSMKYSVVYVENSMRQKYGGIPSVPTVFIINRQGEVVSKYTGYSPELEKKMEATINALL
jgi:peroxiredoxin